MTGQEEHGSTPSTAQDFTHFILIPPMGPAFLSDSSLGLCESEKPPLFSWEEFLRPKAEQWGPEDSVLLCRGQRLPPDAAEPPLPGATQSLVSSMS